MSKWKQIFQTEWLHEGPPFLQHTFIDWNHSARNNIQLLVDVAAVISHVFWI